MLLMGLFILSFLLSKQALSMLNFQLAAIFLISLPYFFSFSHPTYHFSILPIVAIGAGIFWEPTLENEVSEFSLNLVSFCPNWIPTTIPEVKSKIPPIRRIKADLGF